jgi:hypothetical protein
MVRQAKQIIGMMACSQTIFIDLSQWPTNIHDSFKLSAVRNFDLGSGGTRSRTDILNSLDNLHTFGDLSEHNVLSIQPASLRSTQEN